MLAMWWDGDPAELRCFCGSGVYTGAGLGSLCVVVSPLSNKTCGKGWQFSPELAAGLASCNKREG